MLEIKNPDLTDTEIPKLREREINFEEQNPTGKVLFPPEESYDVYKYTDAIKKSEKLTKGQDILYKKIIESKGKDDEDITKLENALLGYEEAFQPLLSQLNDSKIVTKSQYWVDVDSENLSKAHESFTVDNDLINDPNIPDICPPLDSELNFKSSVSDYNSRNYSKKKERKDSNKKAYPNKCKSKSESIIFSR